MLKSILTGLLITMLWSAAFSQDVIRLTDGSRVSGKVTERIVGDRVRVQMEDGSYSNLPDDSVAHIMIDKRKHRFVMKTVGYFNHTSLNFTVCDYFAAGMGPSFQMVNGWQWNDRWMTGIGLGYESIAFQRLLPTTVDVRYNLGLGKTSAYLQGFAGYGISLGDGYYDGPARDWWAKPYGKNYGGVTAGLSLGYRNYRSSHFGYTLSLGFRYQHTKSEYPDVFFEGEQIKFAMTERLNLPMLQFGFGLMFR
jgi:hypothetical protein